MLTYPKDANGVRVSLDTTTMYRKKWKSVSMRSDILNRIRNLRGETHGC